MHYDEHIFYKISTRHCPDRANHVLLRVCHKEGEGVMRLLVEYAPEETRITNFDVAREVMELCGSHGSLDAVTVAKLILVHEEERKNEQARGN